MSTSAPDSGIPVAPSAAKLTPLGIDDVTITGGFWGDKQTLNADASLEHCEEWVERSGWVHNFDAALAGNVPAERRGPSFADSDVYKLIEAMAWEYGRTHDEALNGRIEALVARIEPVQEDDGYLNTNFGRPGQAPRYSDLEWGHELYSYGHLLQAAVARGRTVGDDDRLVQIAKRVADHVCEVFGADGIQRVCGHPEIEVALVEFGRHLNEQRYIDQAKLFIDRRGHGTLGQIPFGALYFQDDQPVRDTTVFGGHSVRALYLAAGSVDVATETKDPDLLEAVSSAFATTIARRTYITGGMGAHHEGEAFGQDYELPSDRAYSETCAGIGSIMVAHRLLLETGDARYSDIIERTLYNVVATSLGEEGKSYFYANTLHQREAGITAAEHEASHRAASSSRAPWFDVSCCPTNVARTLASLGGYLATSTSGGVQLHQYAPADIKAVVNGVDVHLRVSTSYPDDGAITIEVVEAPASEWQLSLRVPGWATEGATLTDAGTTAEVKPGTVTVKRAFAAGDKVELSLPVAPRFIWPDARVDAVRGQLAVERGPLVLALESVDIDGASVNDIRLTSDHKLGSDGAETTVDLELLYADEGPWPYEPDSQIVDRPSSGVRTAKLIPYHSWANRGASTMRIWLPA